MSTTKFNLTAEPGTDIWPPAYSTPPKPLDAFLSASVTFSAPWTEQYDQAGLLLLFQSKGASSSPETSKWIKTGLEFYEGAPQLSTVACDRWADWSVTPLPGGMHNATSVTVSIEREESPHGSSLWVYYIPKEGNKVPLREICWVYGDNDGGKDVQLTVGAYTARPEAQTTTEALKVEFSNLEVKWEN